RKLAKIMKKLDYKISISEIHHTQKVDTPSGTAITLHDDLIKIMNDREIPIKSKRIDNEIGTHEVTYTSEIDKISFKHEAKNREGFALGALLSAKWILDKKGIFNFRDVLKDI
ncbi:MAG: 4-hydroxy-tetrahydrodipicolinate reductase, partial [Flavobacteriales bacterium]|nr:4-hydroxy-tetrahydrodipicolinate reductase [Flavobacteriales bacterium]